MNIQVKASFRKEFLAFFRTGKYIIAGGAIIGLAILSPLMITGLGSLMDSMSDIYNDMGMDVSVMTGMLGNSSSLGVASSVSDITGVGLMILLLLINSAAGGELKRRAVIIPRSAGLRSFGYIFPKFIVYPLCAFVFAIVGMIASWAVSLLVYEVNDVSFVNVMLAGVIAGVCMMLYVCFHITIGTATGKAGMSAAICIVSSFLLSNMFALFSIDYMFNPFALSVLAGTFINDSAITGTQLADVVYTILFTLALMVFAYFIALFAQNAKKVDNTGDDIAL